MDIVKKFENNSFSSIRKEVKKALDEKLQEKRNKIKVEESKTLIFESKEKKKLIEGVVKVVATASNASSSIKKTGSKVIMTFDSVEQAQAFLMTSGIQKVKQAQNVFMDYSRFYHIIPAVEDDKSEDHGPEDNDKRNSDDDDSGGDMSESMNEAIHVSKNNVYDQVLKISKGSNGVLTFEDGDESPLSKASAIEILKYMDKQPPFEKAKYISLLSKNLSSFMNTLDSIVG